MVSFHLEDKITVKILPHAYQMLRASAYSSAFEKLNPEPDGTYVCTGFFNYIFSAFNHCHLLDTFSFQSPIQGGIKINKMGIEVSLDQPICIHLRYKGGIQLQSFANSQVGMRDLHLLKLDGQRLSGPLRNVIKAIVNDSSDRYMTSLARPELIYLAHLT